MIKDSIHKYGVMSRAFHWAMALLFFWQLSAVFVHKIAKDSALDELMGATHKTVGLLVIILIVLRTAWALTQLKRRPPELNLASKLGHIGLYTLMIVMPLVALLRQYGSGRAFEVLGLTIFEASDRKIQWMIDLGSTLHSNLAWLLFAAIAGHITMVIVHRKSAKHQDVLPRMLG